MKTRRRNYETCPACGHKITIGGGTMCAGCLRRFHSRCLIRVKIKNARKGYWLCQECYEKSTKKLHVSKSMTMRTTRRKEPGTG